MIELSIKLVNSIMLFYLFLVDADLNPLKAGYVLSKVALILLIQLPAHGLILFMLGRLRVVNW